MDERCYWIALGGNLGDPLTTFRAARHDISQMPHCTLLASSHCYRTPPIGPAGQPDYRNAVIAIRSSQPPLVLLHALQRIETRYGRVRAERWGARTLDLDIIATACDDNNAEIIELPELHIPHIEMQHRQFVLKPLCDLVPQWQHPRLKQSAKALLAALLAAGEPPLPEGEPW